MRNTRRAISMLLGSEVGQDIIEYGLLAALVAVAVLVVLLGFSDPLNTLYRDLILPGLESAATAGS